MTKKNPFQPPRKGSKPPAPEEIKGTIANTHTNNNGNMKDIVDNTDKNNNLEKTINEQEPNTNIDNIDNSQNYENNGNSDYSLDFEDTVTNGEKVNDDYDGLIDSYSDESNHWVDDDNPVDDVDHDDYVVDDGDTDFVNSVDRDFVDDDYYDDSEKKGGKRVALGLAGAVLAIAVGAGGFYFLNQASNAVPVAQAQEYVSYDDTGDLCEPFSAFNCTVEWEFSDEPNGTLLRQSISSGEEAQEGETIVLTYSRGPETVVVPNVVGLMEEDARQQLYNAGLDVKVITKVDAPGRQAGSVVEVIGVNVGDSVPNSSEVNLNVANGEIAVPDWTGKTKEFVQAEADNMGLNVTFREEESDSPVGTVISQSVMDETVNEGDAVEVVLAKSFEEAQVEIPDVITQSQEEAQSNLAAAGFRKIVSVVVKNDDVTETQVTQVVPGVGTEVGVDENITIIVSEPTDSEDSENAEESTETVS